MSSLKFELVVYGGIADEPEARVAADKVGDILKGMTLDVQEICRNLSGGEDIPLAERLKECRVYVAGVPQKGQSIAFPMQVGDSAADWGAMSMQAYVTGVQELRDSTDLGSPTVPRGFGADILQRVRRYCQDIESDHVGFTVVLPTVNGTPPSRATFDARLKSAVDLKLAAIAHAETLQQHDAPDHHLYGYSLQGVLFQLSDPHYDSPEGSISVQIDARDGRHWVCHIDKSIVPPNLQDLWRSEVLVTGDATIRKRKPVIQAKTFKSLPGMADPIGAMDSLIALFRGASSGEPLQAFMDRVRERD